MKWIVREIVKQEYIYEVEAETGEQATRIVEQGEAGLAKSTRELKPQHITHPAGYPFSVPV
ncbi:hypothetical protein LCGC14_0365810 [marine sediment metagenome]|uniref:Uncharacterized protein n=1 Tax=marine sediment metagenome TaxID=412755 RepID=A0A0F9TCN7_9ZZZZ